jgi:hypothetical protein
LYPLDARASSWSLRRRPPATPPTAAFTRASTAGPLLLLQTGNKASANRPLADVILIQKIASLSSNGNAQRRAANGTNRAKSGGIDMKTSNANVIVYIKKSVRHELSREISQSIAALQGVTSAVSSRKSDNMISVDYDSGTVGSQHILQVAREHGVPARLVGM